MSQHAREFQSFDKDRLREILEAFPFRRRVTAVHLHHTWRPNHSQYRGLETMLGMWRFHTREQGWSDIAQHLTIAPDGTLWSGRDWNRPPASSKGFNGSGEAGPFMIEMIGDFDAGRDRLEHRQRDAVVQTLAELHEFFDLPNESLTFHNALSSKSCPGSAVDRQQLLKEVGAARARIRQEASRAKSRGPRPFSDRALAVQGVVAALAGGNGHGRAVEDPADAELSESGAAYAFGTNGSRAGAEARGGFELTPRILAELAPHVVNLSDGRLSAGGDVTSEPGMVRAIFEDHLPRELEAAKEAGKPLRILFYAHGGLVSEKGGMATAYKHLAWWRANGIYPISFVWETGLWETVRSMVLGRRAPDERGRGPIRDRVVEELVRRVGGPKVWSGMKRSAERAVERPPKKGAPPESYGGARFVAELLAGFLKKHANEKIELHAACHSAGSIFHSHFLPVALEEGVKSFETTQLLAPAVTIDEFRDRLARLAGKKIGPVTIFTMKKAFELRDDELVVYGKSLLYLIHRVLEPQRETEILGLETSLRGDAGMRALFALDGTAPERGEVVFSPTVAHEGRSASAATSHSDFDDDAPTMNSVVRRVLGVRDSEDIEPFNEYLKDWKEHYGGLRGLDADDELAELDRQVTRLFAPVAANGNGHAYVGAAAAAGPMTTASAGRRRALCVGIDRYATDPLSGCVADARLWAETLIGLGFETPSMLLDEEATRSAILGGLEDLLIGAEPGDVLVFQYAGHGTQLPDLDGDEDDGQDEALCSFDWEEGRAVLDDDLKQVFAGIPAGVNVTVFMDCCHSGTNTRVAGARPPRHPDPGARRRYVAAPPEVRDRHADFRRGLGSAPPPSSRGPAGMRELSLAACMPHELAWESDGQGEFTLHATRILRTGADLSHDELERRVRQAFGPTPRQQPLLDCDPAARSRRLFAPLTAGPAPTVGAASAGPGVSTATHPGVFPGAGRIDVAQLLRSIAEFVD